ncbi:MAG: DUF3078 domain-containing protein [Bacteroidales bacterium]
MRRIFFFLMTLAVAANAFGQSGVQMNFPTDSARKYIRDFARSDLSWRSEKVLLREDLLRLFEHAGEPFDSVRQRIAGTEFDTISVFLRDILIRDSLQVRWLNDSTFILDSMGWNMNLFLTRRPEIRYTVDDDELLFADTLQNIREIADSILHRKRKADTVMVTSIDTAALRALALPMYRYSGNNIIPSPEDPAMRRSARITPDSAFLVYTDTLSLWMADPASPFRYLAGKHQLDSLQQAVETLLEYTEQRDSTRLVLNDMYGGQMPLWLTTGKEDFYRFWIRNDKNDSITLWIGNPRKNEISLLLEDAIDVNRLTRERTKHIPVTLREPDRSLEKMELLEPDPVSWEYGASSAFTFNQTYLSNWVKGGENSLSSMLDITGSATYTNKANKTQWVSEARLKYGTIITEEHGLRKNTDQLVFNSQFNRNVRGKFDLSAVFYMKNQIGKGYDYPNDSVTVSKFLNPASLTVGLGVDYKPFKHTSINLAPLSYKNTFVLDTARIDQTQHGISENQRARQEMGTQLVVRNKISPLEDMTVANSVRLFSSYLNKPQNIDVDWEMILDQKISWFFTVRLNLHLIYDDDIRFPVLDEGGEPVLLPDGSRKKSPKAQFKEFVGVSLLFRL